MAEKINIAISTQKTKYMVTSKEPRRCKLEVESKVQITESKQMDEIKKEATRICKDNKPYST